MARAFTTSFSYNGNSYMAVISQFDGAVNIYVPDESLHSILPNGKATFYSDQELKPDQSWPSSAQHLLQNILTSMELWIKETNKIAETKA